MPELSFNIKLSGQKNLLIHGSAVVPLFDKSGKV